MCAHRRGSRFPRSFGGSRSRQTDWFVGAGGTTPLALSASVAAIVGSGVAVAGDSVTMVRLRGALDLNLLTSSAGGAGFQGAFGLGMVTTPAFVAGIVSMPTPLTDVEWDGWFYHTFLGVHGNAGTAVDSPAASLHMEVDSKAMRKWDGDGEVTIFAALEVIEIGTATADFFFDSRLLVKLH